MEAYASAPQVYAAGLIFARLGALLMLMPGVGDGSVPVRIRLAFAVLFALMLFPVLGGQVGAVPATNGAMFADIFREILIGLMIGLVLRMMLAALGIAGEIVSIQSTLAFSQTANPGQAQPSTSLSTFLTVMGVTLIMATDLHHMFLAAIVSSYRVFPFGGGVPVGDAAQLAVQTAAQSFSLGLQLAAPVVVFSLIFNVAAGLVGRVMPAFQIFFVATPLLVLSALSIFALSLGVLGMVWVERYRELIALFL
ncbi:flagellar biosynthetic protein FliR [Phenylobacterium sp.]|uniref:flagellar biosynthetic protein FliR n=1 Tax=Phenylobacterium sp. TaxID=1871053 RepID=UPI0027310777|nr:flagellar biosynthetic protein FliR [Phenylobacterium sp.]MDP1616901.1 flagellar biosynthetic protein FliR [Phenylobacterium sp.]MDP1988459.1 flagellar biosynthetic protein FliR [Phenylobacterium sp.]